MFLLYLQGFGSRLLQQLDGSSSCTLQSSAIVPGEVPPRPSTQLLLEVLWKSPVLHRRSAETETGCGCRDDTTEWNDYICQRAQTVLGVIAKRGGKKALRE